VIRKTRIDADRQAAPPDVARDTAAPDPSDFGMLLLEPFTRKPPAPPPMLSGPADTWNASHH